jgi:hypothetical protein
MWIGTDEFSKVSVNDKTRGASKDVIVIQLYFRAKAKQSDEIKI